MKKLIASKLVVPASSLLTLAAIDMTGANALDVTFEVEASPVDLVAVVYAGNDGANWSQVSAVGLNRPGATSFEVSGIKTRLARVDVSSDLGTAFDFGVVSGVVTTKLR